MPENVFDRCTKSHEFIFLLSKSKKYYFDLQSIKVETADGGGRKNPRSVWSVTCNKIQGRTLCKIQPRVD